MGTVKKMQLWSSQLDDKYFDDIDKKRLLGFTKECETFTYLLQMMYQKDAQMSNNPLIRSFMEVHNKNRLADLMGEYAAGKEVKEVAATWRDETKIVTKIEEGLKTFLSDVKPGQYSEKEIIEFYENISLRRNVWLSFFSCQNMMETLDFKVLERSRF
jgi:hypothetical protein